MLTPLASPGRTQIAHPMSWTASGSAGWWGAPQPGRPGLRGRRPLGGGHLGPRTPRPRRPASMLHRGAWPGTASPPLGCSPKSADIALRSVPCGSDCPAAGSEAPGPSLPPCAATATGPRGLSCRSRPARFLPGRSRQVARVPRGRRRRQRGALLAAGIGRYLHGLRLRGLASPGGLGRLLNQEVRCRIGLGLSGVVGRRWLLVLVPAGAFQQLADVAMHPT